ncbi:MAG: type II secretion system protein J [Cyanobium sp.]
MTPPPQDSLALHARSSATRGSARGSEGFSLVELVLAGSLMAVVIGSTATALLVANNSSSSQGGLSRVDSLIDQDLAAIQALDRQFTCCTGDPCTANATTIAASDSCRDALGVARGPGNENYYSPRQSHTNGRNPADTPDMERFRDACGDGTIASTFQSMLPTLPTAEAPAALSRSVKVPNTTTNLLQITYTGKISGSTVFTRVVNLIPTAANWCP